MAAQSFWFLLSLPVVLASGLLAACSPSEPGVPMEFSKACAVENDKKVVEMSGFLSASVTVFCSNRSGRMECAYKFTETPGAEKSISADIEQGSGSNSAEKLKSGFKREDIKIRDHAGNLINLAERVRLTGKLSVSPDLRACFMKVAMIQR
jgi:hypothetical protein